MVVTQDDVLFRGKCDIPQMTKLFWASLHDSLSCHAIWKTHTFQTYSFSNRVNQTNNKSIYSYNHTDFLSSAIIRMVYMLTELFLKSEASREPCSLGATADVTLLQQYVPLSSHSAVYLEIIMVAQLGPCWCKIKSVIQLLARNKVHYRNKVNSDF